MKSVILGLLLVVVSCQPEKGNKVRKITILHTNDHHGRFWENRDGEYGLAARATLIRQLREEIHAEGGESLLIDAGDVNTGVPQSDLLDAEPDFRGMNAIGYDVMAIGNHEFDKPLEVIKKQQKEWAKFPFISANIYYENNNKRVFPSHISRKLNGLNVVIFGLTTEDTPKKSRPEHSKGLFFRPAVEEAKSIVPKLRPKADVLIALTHTGHYPDENHGADAPGDVSIARAVKGIDVIVGGHSQKPLFEPDVQNGTIIVQAHEWGKYVGRIDLEVGEDNKVVLKKYELIPVNLKNSQVKIEPDENIRELLRPFKEEGDRHLLIEIGSADEEFIGRRDVVRFQETNLGNLVGRAFKEKFNADLAVVNSGGLRDSIYPGLIRIETVLMVLPFAGEVVTAELTGDELKKYLEQVVKLTPGSGSFPQLTGVSVVLDKASGAIKELKVGSEEVSPTGKYMVALPEFIATGGDKYPVVSFRKYGYVDADLLKEYIEKVKNLKAEDFGPTGDIRFE